MLRQIKPRNARSKRALEKREPLPVENPKTALYFRFTTCSQIVQDALADLYTLTIPNAKKFTKKNDIHPFEDATSFEFFSSKNDASLLIFGSTSKKRPHTVTLARTFDHKILDMLELHLDVEGFRTLKQFKAKKCAAGLRPMLLFCGTPWESPVSNSYTSAKSLFVDLFRGEEADKVDVEGLQYIMVFSARDEVDGEETKPMIHLRVYMIRTKRSGQRLPRVEVEEMGPRMDFRVGRLKDADEAMMKEAMRRAKTSVEKPKKNVSTDLMGDKLGRIHLGRQNLKELQTRKMKGLKRSRDVVDDDALEAPISEDEGGKKSRKA